MFRDERYIGNDVEVRLPAHLHFGKYLLDRIRQQPTENIALINAADDTKITYGEIAQSSVDLAVPLTKLGFGRGDVVALCSESRNDLMPITLSVLYTGATYVPSNLEVGKDILQCKFELIKCNRLIYSKLFWEKYKDILKNFEFETLIIIDDVEIDDSISTISTKSLITKHYNVHHYEPANVEGQKDVALILFSSGSSGIPKGIIKTHLICIKNCLVNSFMDPSLKTCVCYFEWCHSFNGRIMYKFLATGRTIAYFNDDIDVFFKCIEKYKGNIAFLFPYYLLHLLKHDLEKYNLESLKYIYCGTAPLNLGLRDKFIKRFPFLQTLALAYGMTETHELTADCWGEPGSKPSSVGKPGPGITLKVSICVDAHNVFSGYIGIDPSTYLDDEGFFRTGDLGYYDEEGYFYIVDRIREIICNGGFTRKVTPEEIEIQLLTYPGVKDVGVAGIPSPNYIQVPGALVVKESNSNITENDILNFIASECGPHMKLVKMKFINEIPRSSQGKILRQDIRKMFEEDEI